MSAPDPVSTAATTLPPGAVADRLAITISVTIAGTTHKVAPGDVKQLELELLPWGFGGRVEFVRADSKALGGTEKDTLLADFLKPDLATVELEVKAVLSDEKGTPTFTAMKVKALVTDKALVELPVDSIAGDKLLYRRYSLGFLDAAQLLWSQHHPCELYTEKSFKDVIAAHVTSDITVTCDWAAELDNARPMVFLGLPASHGASFHDFVAWLLDSRGGVMAYDYSAQSYRLAEKKDASATPIKARALDVASLRVDYPEVIRHSVNVLNSYTESAAITAVAQDQAADPIRHDVLLSTPIADEVSARVTRETNRLKVRGAELALEWRRFPTTMAPPNALVTFDDTAGWEASGLTATTGTFRVVSLSLRAVAIGQGPDNRHLGPDAPVHLWLTSRLEQKDEPTTVMPPYQTPRYPHYAEGRIVSEVGEEADETWQVYTDQKTNVDGYRVKIPLWQDQIITVPFNANLLPGQFYFPAYKGQRVLVAFELLSAWLKRYLDWRAGARLPQEGQGEHLLVGKTTTNGTSIKHVYEDGNPAFTVKRTNAKDTQTIEVKEGVLRITVKEE